MLNLDGKTAIVTGCGSEGEGWGNGRAIATLLARQGAKVIGTDLNFKAAKNTQDFILKENNKCEIYEVNMSNKKDVDSFFKNVTKQHEKINILAISTSEIKLSVIIDEINILNAVKKLHTVFDLD